MPVVVAAYQLVVTRVNVYNSVLVDLRLLRSVHYVLDKKSVQICSNHTCFPHCPAIHKAQCQPITISAILNLQSHRDVPPLVSKIDLDILDPVELLQAVDLEGRLEALVNSFVAQDKVRRSSGPLSPPPSPSALTTTTACGTPASSTRSRSLSPQSHASHDLISTSTGSLKREPKVSRRSASVKDDAQPATAVAAVSNHVSTSTGKKKVDASTMTEPRYTRKIGKSEEELAAEKRLEEAKNKVLEKRARQAGSKDGSTDTTSTTTTSPKSRTVYTLPAPKRITFTSSTTNFVDNYIQTVKQHETKGTRLRDLVEPRRGNECDSPGSSDSGEVSLVDYLKQTFSHDDVNYRASDKSAAEKFEELFKRKPQQNVNSIVSVNEVKSKWESMAQSGNDSLSLPHPKLTNTQKQHIRDRDSSNVKPFLSKGSVAERVLIFEKCPDKNLERGSTVAPWKNIPEHTAAVNHKTELHKKPPGFREIQDPSYQVSSLKRVVKSTKRCPNSVIPRFYYPEGKPPSASQIESQLQRVTTAFASLKDGKATRENFDVITKACELPLYWKMPLFIAAGGVASGFITCDQFVSYWKKIIAGGRDEPMWFVKIFSRGQRTCLVPDDFIPLVQDVIEAHPGLSFLKEAIEFHSRYINTVIARIFYNVNSSWSGRITVPELRKSNLLRIISLLEEEEDINQITEYFSYEHFYVIYCKFWELDKDHDLYIDKYDLSRHNDGALSTRIIDRIFSGTVTRDPVGREMGRMSYSDFVWFLLSEEDKKHPRSVEYWFRCMDVDGDGYLSMYELEYFYEEQLMRLDSLGIEALPFNDCLCQMLDMVKPKDGQRIALSDLKRCKMTPVFFDTFINLEKYLDHEQRDPFASREGEDDVSDWDRYAADEYELLVAEESVAGGPHHGFDPAMAAAEMLYCSGGGGGGDYGEDEDESGEVSEQPMARSTSLRGEKGDYHY